MVTVGTRGDTEPYCALSLELLKRNHFVDIFIQSNHLSLIRPLKQVYPTQLQVHVLPFTNQDYYKVPHEQRQSSPSSSLVDDKLKNVKILADIIGHLVFPCADRIQSVAKQCHVMITCALARPLCVWIAHRLFQQQLLLPLLRHQEEGKRDEMKLQKTVILHLQPLLPNRYFPCYRISKTKFVQAILQLEETTGPRNENNSNEDDQRHRDSYWKIEHPLEEIFLKERCRELGMLPKIAWNDLQDILTGHNSRYLVVNAYSNELIPSVVNAKHGKEKKGVGPYAFELGGSLADTYLPPNFRGPPPLLSEFLSDGPPPICIGFGSMPFRRVQIVLEALRKLNRRAVLVGETLRPPSDDEDNNNNNLLYHHVSSIPYSFLLPKCSMMICHGGAGVVHACLRAGIPCLISPLMGDQFSFAALVEAKGLGVQCGTKLSTLTCQDIVEAVRRIEGILENKLPAIRRNMNQELSDFLCNGPPPICIGFGSMPFRKVNIVLEALKVLNRRAVLVGETLKPPSYCDDDDNNNLYHYVSSISYSIVLPWCSMMICHGGAGVVHACLRAGIPCLISPLVGDQFSFAELVEDKGLGAQCGTKLSTLTCQDIVRAVRKMEGIQGQGRKMEGIQGQRSSTIRIKNNHKSTIGAVERLANLLEDSITMKS